VSFPHFAHPWKQVCTGTPPPPFFYPNQSLLSCAQCPVPLVDDVKMEAPGWKDEEGLDSGYQQVRHQGGLRRLAHHSSSARSPAESHLGQGCCCDIPFPLHLRCQKAGFLITHSAITCLSISFGPKGMLQQQRSTPILYQCPSLRRLYYSMANAPIELLHIYDTLGHFNILQACKYQE
jgi:hypothetical protein